MITALEKGYKANWRATRGALSYQLLSQAASMSLRLMFKEYSNQSAGGFPTLTHLCCTSSRKEAADNHFYNTVTPLLK